MNTRGVLLLALAIVVAGCAPQEFRTQEVRVQAAARKMCPGQSCDLVVYVSGDPAAGNPVVVVDFSELKMSPGNGDAVIVWRLEAKGYEFRKGSIAPKPEAVADWNAQIRNSRNSSVTFEVTNANSKKVELPYTIKVWHKKLAKEFTLIRRFQRSMNRDRRKAWMRGGCAIPRGRS